ncbi:hypothetical protein GCM10009624_28790 [Gordonia sinesedis]
MRRRHAAIAAGAMGAATVAATAGIACAAPAQAAPGLQNVGMNCTSLNPNILDVPHFAGVTVYPNTAPGKFSISGDSKSIFPYTSDTRVTVTELATNRSQTVTRQWQHGFSDGTGYTINDLRGKGRVKITIATVNHGLIPNLPAPVCIGYATV